MVSLVVIITIILLLLLSFIVTILFLYQKRQSLYDFNIRRIQTEFEKTLLATRIEIQESTIQNISREIHDNVSLSLILAKLNLNTISFTNNAEIKAKTNSALDQITKAIIDLSDLSKSMSADLIVSQGLIKAIDIEVARIGQMRMFDVKYNVSGEPIFLDSQKELVIFRIIQEALNNIIKHSKATEVKIEIQYYHDNVSIKIEDNGIGFSVPQSDLIFSAGLNNMRKRTAVFHGEITIKSTINLGTNIFIKIPYNERE